LEAKDPVSLLKNQVKFT